MSAEHATKQYSIFKIALNLTITCFISGVILASLNYFTAPIAAQKAIVIRNNTMKSLVKDADEFKPIQEKTDWFEAVKGGQTIAYVVPADTKGFGGSIKLLVAVTKDGKVIGYDISSHNETPGLGDNATKDPFKGQFKGKTSADLEVTKDPSNTKNIQAMTGATITSRAVTKGVKEAVDEVSKFVGGNK